MHFYGLRQEGDRQGLSRTSGDGDDDSDETLGIKQDSMSSSLSTPRHSEIGSPLLISSSLSSSPSLCDAGRDDATTTIGRMGLSLPPSRKSMKDRRDHKRGRGCTEVFLLAAAVILLLPTMIAVKVITARISNNNSTMLFRENFDDRDSSSLLLAQHRFQRQQRRFLQNDEIQVTLPVGAQINDANISEIIAEQITMNSTVGDNTNNNNNGSPDTNDGESNLVTDAPLSPTFVTKQPTLEPSTTNTPSYSPLASVSPRPTTGRPSAKPSASNEPSVAPSPSPSISPKPSGFPSAAPTAETTVSQGPSAFPSVSFEPTVSFSPTPSPSSSISPKLFGFSSAAPTAEPTVSQGPSAFPSVSFEPTVSFSPTLEPQNITKNVIMILENMPSLLQNDTIGIWENVTSKHMIDYYETVSETYPNNWSIQIKGVRTIFKSQTISPGKEADDSKNEAVDDLFPASRQDEPMDLPPTTFTETPDTLKVEIVYDQWVTYESYEGNITDDELYDRLFILPYTTDSFHYSMDLFVAMNWSNWVIVDIVEDIEQEAQETPPPITEPIASRLTLAQTFAISASIVTAACLIVLFLFWERNQKLDVNAAMNLRREEESLSINSAIEGIQGTPARTSSEVEQAVLPWNNLHYNHNNNNGNATTTDGTIISSARSAPGHLRKDSIERGRLGSKDSMEGRHSRVGSNDTAPFPSNGIYGTERSGHSKSSSNSSNVDNNQEFSPKPYSMEVNYGSPGTPQNVPAGIRDTIAHSSTNRNNSNRPYLPPLPPPSSFGSNTHDRRRNAGDQYDSSTSLIVPLNDYNNSSSSSSSNNNINISSSSFAPTAFRRPNRGFGMQASALSDDSMTDLSFVTDPFSSDRQHSTEILMQNPQLSEASSRSRSETIRSQYESFTSPLYIPDEEGISSVGPRTATESHISTMSTMLGLESRPIDDAL
jgi:hypothetical protein